MDDTVLGLLLCIVTAAGFGSMFVPVKPYRMEDGFFVQWVECAAGIMLSGVVVGIFTGFQFYMVAFIGGVLLATGGITAIPIVNLIGMGLGPLIWGSVQIVIGWATGRFGLLGLKPEVPKSDLFEYLGVALTIVSAFIFAAVKPAETEHKTDEEKQQLQAAPEQSGFAKYRTMILAVALAVYGGICYGVMLTPITWYQENVYGASQDGLDYAFSFSCGAACASTFYFIVYCAYKWNKPFINPKVAFPAFLYGVLWSVAFFAWLVSNVKLSQSIAFPINTRLPGVVAAIWGVLYYKEVRGFTNLMVLLAAIIVACVGVVLVGLADVVET